MHDYCPSCRHRIHSALWQTSEVKVERPWPTVFTRREAMCHTCKDVAVWSWSPRQQPVGWMAHHVTPSPGTYDDFNKNAWERMQTHPDNTFEVWWLWHPFNTDSVFQNKLMDYMLEHNRVPNVQRIAVMPHRHPASGLEFCWRLGYQVSKDEHLPLVSIKAESFVKNVSRLFRGAKVVHFWPASSILDPAHYVPLMSDTELKAEWAAHTRSNTQVGEV